MELELKKAVQEYDKTFQESKQIIGDEISDFCNSQPPLDHSLTADGPPPVTQNINDNTPCGCEIDGKTFCNFDFGDTGNCETCYDHTNASSCENAGLPDKGALDCKNRCFNDTTPLTQNINDKICRYGDNINGHFCNYDDGYEGTYESCEDHEDVRSCDNGGLPDEGALDCKDRCFNDKTPLQPKIPECTKSQIKKFIVNTKNVFLSTDQLCGNIQVDNKKCKIDIFNHKTCGKDLEKCKSSGHCVFNDLYYLNDKTKDICNKEIKITQCDKDDLLKFFKSSKTSTRNCMFLPKSNVVHKNKYTDTYCNILQNVMSSKICVNGTRSKQDVICKESLCFNTKTKELCLDE